MTEAQTMTAIKAIENWQHNKMTSFTPRDILFDFGDVILAALRTASVPGAVRALATTLLDFIDNEGPSATAWEPISATAKALRAALATPEEASTEAQPDCNLCFGKGSVVDRYDVVDCKACGGSGTASTAAGEVVDPACMLATASNEPCKPTGENHKRCAICGFIVDASFAATKPTIDFTMAGRSKKSAAPPAAQTDGVRQDILDRAIYALTELTAQVRGECPSLLNEDSGGDAHLSIEIDAILALAQPPKDGSTVTHR